MKKRILLVTVILLSIAGLVQAQNDQLSGTVDITYLSSHIWRGFDYYANDHSAIQPGVNIDLYNTGFGIKVLHSRAVSAPFENAEFINLTLYYGDNLFIDETYTTNYTAGWVYYGFPDESRGGSSTSSAAQAADMQELFVSLSWPQVCPMGIVPSYTVISMWPSESKSRARNNAGWAHVFELGYDMAVAGLTPETSEQILHLSVAAVYNEGLAPGVASPAVGRAVDHDWSHAVFGVSTDFELDNNLTFTPGLYYQSSWEDSVNTEDECWLSLSMRYVF